MNALRKVFELDNHRFDFYRAKQKSHPLVIGR